MRFSLTNDYCYLFFSDPILFPSFIHTQKRNPETHLKDPTAFWDFISLRPETTHQVSFLFSDRGTPDGYRHMNGYGSHAFKNVNSAGEAVYVKYHLKVRICMRVTSPCLVVSGCCSLTPHILSHMYYPDGPRHSQPSCKRSS